MTKYLTRAEAAQYIKDTYAIPCTSSTLNKYAWNKTGPLFRKLGGRVTLYDKEDLDTWAKARFADSTVHT